MLQGEVPDESNALVMISRVPIKTPVPKPMGTEDHGGPTSDAVEETDWSPALPLDMSAAIPPKNKRAQVKNRDWRASIQAYNEL